MDHDFTTPTDAFVSLLPLPFYQGLEDGQFEAFYGPAWVQTVVDTALPYVPEDE
jgi:hypothetical protein